jgi:hypothetical protein
VACLLAGQRPPELSRPFRVAYLGGQGGVTPAVIAAAHPQADVWAWDDRPEQVEATRALRDTAGLGNLAVHERRELPHDLGGDLVDIAVVDRVLDRADDTLRTAITTALGESVRPGGLVAVTYRTVVGWAEITPVLAVMRRVAARAAGGREDRARFAVEALRQLRLRGALHLTERPWVSSWLDEVFTLDAATVADEYLAFELRPLSHAAVDALMSETGCAWVGTARPGDEMLEGVATELAELIGNTPFGRLREAYRDLATRPIERIDMFRKGAAPLPADVTDTALSGVELTDLTGQEDPPTIFVSELGDDPGRRLLRTLLANGEAYPSVVPGPADAGTAWARLARTLESA